MLIDRKKFHGSTSYVDKHNTMLSVAGNASWFTEFVPIHFPSIRTFHKLLFHFYRHGLCCFMTGSFVSYIAGALTFFLAISGYMILNDDHPIIRLIFQKGPNVIHHLIIGFFHFELLHKYPDICIYRVRLGYFNAMIFFVGIDTDSSCNYRSNVDFVHFIWDNFERLEDLPLLFFRQTT